VTSQAIEVRSPAGNQRAIRHGANSEALVSTVAEELCDALIGTYPWFLETDVVGIEQYCRLEARARLLADFIDKKVASSRKGVMAVEPYLWGAADRADANAMRAAEAIGLTPMGRMKIAKDAGFVAHFSQDRLGSLVEQGEALLKAGGRVAEE
jgi:Phage terminase, small subunit